MEDIAFMVFGLGFFLFVIRLIVVDVANDKNQDYKRALNEKREFGIELPREKKSKRHQRV